MTTDITDNEGSERVVFLAAILVGTIAVVVSLANADFVPRDEKPLVALIRHCGLQGEGRGGQCALSGRKCMRTGNVVQYSTE